MFISKRTYILLAFLPMSLLSGEEIGDHALRCQRELYSRNIEGALQRVYTVPQGGYLYYCGDPNSRMYDGLCNSDLKALYGLKPWDHYLVQLGSHHNAQPDLYIEGLAIHQGGGTQDLADSHVGHIALRTFCYDYRNETYAHVSDDIAAFPNLKYLDLYCCSMTRENIAKLTGLFDLTYLGLPYSSNDDYLSVAAKFTKLCYLNASWTKITGSGWCELIEMPELQILDMRGNYFKDYNIGDLRSPKLTTLLLAYTNISDSDLFLLITPRLEHLALHFTSISDRGLRYLEKNKYLKYLTVYGTKVTPEGVEALKQKLPELTVVIELDKETDVKMRNRFIDFRKKQQAVSVMQNRTDSSGPKNRPKYMAIPWEAQPLYQYIIEVDTDVDYPIIFEKEDK